MKENTIKDPTFYDSSTIPLCISYIYRRVGVIDWFSVMGCEACWQGCCYACCCAT